MRDRNVYANNHKYGGIERRLVSCYVEYNSSNRVRMWYFAPRSRSQPSEIWRPEWKPLCCIWIMSPWSTSLEYVHTHTHCNTKWQTKSYTLTNTLMYLSNVTTRSRSPLHSISSPPAWPLPQQLSHNTAPPTSRRHTSITLYDDDSPPRNWQIAVSRWLPTNGGIDLKKCEVGANAMVTEQSMTTLYL